MKSAALILTRMGLAAAAAGNSRQDNNVLRALDLEVAQLGYVLSYRLSERLGSLAPDKLAEFKDWLVSELSAHLGADCKHVPLFRRFPEDIPADTFELWLKKFAVYFCQAEDQPCLFCRSTGTTHVLSPCGHVICDKCFDGATYSACPACEQHVDLRSPFFKPASEDAQLRFDFERPRYKLIDLTEDLDEAAKELFVSLCLRKQALSAGDLEALTVIAQDYRLKVLEWLPSAIPVRENVAAIFGQLLKDCGKSVVLEHSRSYIKTATDVLRLIAVYSGADGSLQKQKVWKELPLRTPDPSLWKRMESKFRESRRLPPRLPAVRLAVNVSRFRVAKLPRSMRKEILQILNGLYFQALTEDMLRHRSYWVWLSQFLHPFEYVRKAPWAALAFAVVLDTELKEDEVGESLRRTALGAGVEVTAKNKLKFATYYGRLERAAQQARPRDFLAVLRERPGELARRLDHCLRLFIKNNAAADEIVDAFAGHASQYSNPVLLALLCLMSKRSTPLALRLFFPKGQVVRGVALPDTRDPLPAAVTDSLGIVIKKELLRRFAAKPAFSTSIIDEALRSITVPFNERTASKALVALPRGSAIAVPQGKVLRLFLHWCQTRNAPAATDLDLSVGFYDGQWQYKGVCSYYDLRYSGQMVEDIARSAGDLRDGPYPDGASEFVDLHRERALAEGLRYAVMVVTNYSGQAFENLERGFAGIMLREEAGGKHFDARTVELKFDLQGSSGIFLPLVLDIEQSVLYWIDVNKQGQFRFNNVATANSDIQKICPAMIAYFRSGVRPSMFALAALHAAARSDCVYVRGAEVKRFERRAHEAAEDFYERIIAGAGDQAVNRLPHLVSPVFAAMLRGDIALTNSDLAYALYREKSAKTVAASDLLS